nr:hypothetical protein [uncultured Acetatifactor sp.]
MKEYEYIIEALEGYLCDELTGVICSENYRNKSYGHGYRQIFNEYRRLHETYKSEEEIFSNRERENAAREEFRCQCNEKREDVRIRFLKDIQSCTSIDIKSIMDDYLKRQEGEEAKTIAKRICLYPYMVSVLRKNRSGGKSND